MKKRLCYISLVGEESKRKLSCTITSDFYGFEQKDLTKKQATELNKNWLKDHPKSKTEVYEIIMRKVTKNK